MPYITSVEEIGMEKATRTIALNMLRKNMDLETIAEVTGLTISEVEGFANAQLKKLQAEAK
jgi:predicted transposase YdaD